MTEFSNLGKHCSKQGCGQKDFLPFECKECRGIYCLAHRSATDHRCQVDITQKNVMPLCPICNQYIRVKAGQVPDAIMNDHIVNACKTNLLQSHLEKIERHAKRRCGICSNPEKYETIICKLCEGQFCLTHRAPESHKCDKGKKPKPKKDVSNSRALALMAKIQANKNAKAEEKAAAERELARLVLESESSSRPSVVDEKHVSSSSSSSSSSSARRASVEKEKPAITRQPSQDKPSSTPTLSRQGSSEKSKEAAFPAATGGMVPLTMSSFDANAVPAEEKKIVMSSSSSATPRPDTVIVSQGGSSKSSSSSKTPSSPTPPSKEPATFTDEHIQQLVDIGITPSQAYQALSMFGGNVELAGSYLFTEMQALRDIEARKNKTSSDVKSSSSGSQAATPAPSLPAAPAPVRAPSEQNRRPSDPSLGGALSPSPEMEEAIKRSQVPDAPAGPVPFYKSNVMKGIIASRTDQERELIQKMTTRMLAVGDKKIPESDRFYLEVNYPVEYMNGSMSVAKGKKQLSKYGQSMFFDTNWTVARCIEEIANHAGLEYDPSPKAEKQLDMVGKRTNIHFPHDIPVGLLDPDLRTCDSIILEYT